MTMDVTGILDGIIQALSGLVQWMQNTYISSHGVRVSVFALAVAVLVIDVIMIWFIPWGGESDE